MKTRSELLAALRNEYGSCEAIEHLIDWLIDAWEKRDILFAHFGAVYAEKLFNAPVENSFPVTLASLDDCTIQGTDTLMLN